MKIDTKDINILSILQKNGLTSIQTIANEVGLTNNPCWRRIKNLQEHGVIRRYSIDVDPAALGLKTVAYVSLRTNDHSSAWLTQFSDIVQTIPEIVECHRMSGNVDYLLKVVVRDLTHYDEVYQKLIAQLNSLVDVSASFSMESLKPNYFVDAATSL